LYAYKIPQTDLPHPGLKFMIRCYGPALLIIIWYKGQRNPRRT